jgi:hypothetical protein
MELVILEINFIPQADADDTGYYFRNNGPSVLVCFRQSFFGALWPLFIVLNYFSDLQHHYQTMTPYFITLGIIIFLLLVVLGRELWKGD